MKKYIRYLLGVMTIIVSFLASFAYAEIVDTYQFHNDETRLRAVALAKTLRCPQCQNQNLVESNSPVAYELRLEVYELANQGKSDQQIVQIMSERFGDFVRYDPPFNTRTYLLWGLPIFLLLLAAILLFYYLKQQQRSTALSETQRAELQAFLQQQKAEKRE